MALITMESRVSYKLFLILFFIVRLSSGADKTFLIAPWIDDLKLKAEVASPDRNKIDTSEESVEARVKKLLENIEPGGPKGKVVLGFTLPVNIFDLYSSIDGTWKFDEKKMAIFLRVIKNVGRPTVVNLRANHFFGPSPFAQWLAEDSESLALTNKNEKIVESYFENKVVVPTLSLNKNLRINKYRFEGLREATKRIAEFEKVNPNLIAAVTIAGELHHFTPNVADPSKAGNYDNISKKFALKFPSIDKNKNRFYVDHPKNQRSVFFNPFAAEWQLFREKQVSDLALEFSTNAKQGGLPTNKFFSHGIVPQLEGSWNRMIYAVTDSVLAQPGINAGVSLYGGKSKTQALKKTGIKAGYGVTELHPRMGKFQNQDFFAETIAFHKNRGARFISPYYIFIHRDKAPISNLVADLMIEPNNKRYGSHFFYQAIVDAVKE